MFTYLFIINISKFHRRNGVSRYYSLFTNLPSSAKSFNDKIIVSNDKFRKELKMCDKSLSKGQLIHVHKILENITLDHINEDPNLVSKLGFISLKKKILSKPFWQIINYHSDKLIPKLTPKNLSLVLSCISNLQNYTSKKFSSIDNLYKFTKSFKYEKLILESIKYIEESSKNNFIGFAPLDLSLTLSSLAKQNINNYYTFNISNGLINWLSYLNVNEYSSNICQCHHFALIALHCNLFGPIPQIFPMILKFIKVKDVTPNIAIILLAGMYRHNYTSNKLSIILIRLAFKTGELSTKEIVWLTKLINLQYYTDANDNITSLINLLNKHYKLMDFVQLSSVAVSLSQILNKLSTNRPEFLEIYNNVKNEIINISNLLYENLSKANSLREKATLNLLKCISVSDEKIFYKIKNFLDNNYNRLISRYTKAIIINTIISNKLISMNYDMKTELVSRIDEFNTFELLNIINNIEIHDDFVIGIQKRIYNDHGNNVKVFSLLLSTDLQFDIYLSDLTRFKSALSPTLMVHLCLGIIINIKLYTSDTMEFVIEFIKKCLDLPIKKFYYTDFLGKNSGIINPIGLPNNPPLWLLVTYGILIDKTIAHCLFDCRNNSITNNYGYSGNAVEIFFNKKSNIQNTNGNIDNNIVRDIVNYTTKLNNKMCAISKRYDAFHIDIVL